MSRCRGIWVDGIALTQQTECDGASGACVTYNSFSATIFNMGSMSRSSTATYRDGGVLKYAAVDEMRWEDGVLLVEDEATNLVEYSEDFTQWTKQNDGIFESAPNIPAPDGSTGEVYKVSTPSGWDDQLRKYQSSIVTQGETYTTSGSIFIMPVSAQTTIRTKFDIGNCTSIATVCEPNIWTRIQGENVDVEADGVIGILRVYSPNANEFYVWGGQGELGLTSSYNPTTDSAVTRAADIVRDDDHCTYDWSTTIGTTPGGHSDKTCEVWITSDQNETFTVTLAVTCGPESSSFSKDFVSKNRR